MARRSAADREATLCQRTQNGGEVEIIAPESLDTPALREAFKLLVFEYPQVVGKRGFEGAVANLLLLQAKAHVLCNTDLADFYQVQHCIMRLEQYLGLPSSASHRDGERSPPTIRSAMPWISRSATTVSGRSQGQRLAPHNTLCLL